MLRDMPRFRLPLSTFVLALAALLGALSSGCPAPVPAFASLSFTCDDAAPCAAGFDCVNGQCVPADEGHPVDAGPRDAGPVDAGPRPDGGAPDAGLTDGGVVDAGAPDAGLSALNVAVSTAFVRVGDVVSCSASPATPVMALDYTWHDGTVARSYTVQASDLPGTDVVCTVEATTADGTRWTDSAAAMVQNTPPTVTVALSPEMPYAGQNVTCLADAADVNGDAPAVRYAWHDGSLSGTYTVRPGDTRGTTLTCTVTATDMHGGTSETTATAVVGNAPPVVTDTTVAPAVHRVGDTLTCTAEGTDIDGDAVSLAFAWSDGQTGSTAVAGGAPLTCTVTAQDPDGATGTGTATSTTALAPESCGVWHAAGATADGVYSIDPQGVAASADHADAAFDVHCHFTAGAGWTLLLSATAENTAFGNSGPGWTAQPDGMDPAPATLSDADHVSLAYAALSTSEIMLCLASTGACDVLAHGMDRSLRSFFTDNVTYTAYAHRSTGYPNTADGARRTAYLNALGLSPRGTTCYWLGINDTRSKSAIGLLGDVNGGCDLNGGFHDDLAVGLGVQSCADNNGCPHGGAPQRAGQQCLGGIGCYQYSQAQRDADLRGPWFVFGR